MPHLSTRVVVASSRDLVLTNDPAEVPRARTRSREPGRRHFPSADYGSSASAGPLRLQSQAGPMLSSGSSPGLSSVVGSAPCLREAGSVLTRSASASGSTAPANGTSRGSERRSSALGSLGVVMSR